MSSGFTAKAGIKDASAWAETFVQADTPLPIVSEGITKVFDLQRSKALIGQAAAHDFQNGHENVSGPIGLELDYDSADILEYAMGAEAGGVYSFTNDLDKMFHLELEKNVTRYRYQTAKVDKLTISGEAGSEDPVQISADLFAASEIRSSTAYPSITMTPSPVFFEDMTYFRVADQLNALAAGDAICIKSFEISIENKLEGSTKDSCSNLIKEPIRNDFRVVTLKIQIARYNTTGATLFNAWKINNTLLQADMLFAGSAGTYIFQFPEMKIVDGDNWNLSGPGVIEGEITLEGFVNNNNSYMAIDDQLQITRT